QGRRRSERALDAGDDDIEIVECADRDHPRDAAFGRVRIDIVEPFEVGRILDVAEQRERVLPNRSIGCGLRRRDRAKVGGKPQHRGCRSDGAALQKMSSGYRQMRIPGYGPGRLLFWSHDLSGKPVSTFPDHAPVSARYKARVRQITLLFPHDNSRKAVTVRRNVPVTTMRSGQDQPTKNGQAMPGRAVGCKSMPDCRNVISPPSEAEPACRPASPDRRSRRHARCPSGYRQSPWRYLE